MNANELTEIIEHLENAKYIGASKAAEMLRQQQADLKDADKYALELERLYEDAKAEIEALKNENKVLRKGELWLGMVYNNRGMGIAPMYLENFMRFCETNGFTEESGYKLFKAQE